MIRRIVGKTLGLLGYTIQYGCIAHCAFEYIGEVVICSGPSMEPTIRNYDVLLCDNLSRHFFSIHKGDIIVAKSPDKPSVNICKRVIGLEGDKVCMSSPSALLKRHTYVGIMSLHLMAVWIPCIYSCIILVYIVDIYIIYNVLIFSTTLYLWLSSNTTITCRALHINLKVPIHGRFKLPISRPGRFENLVRSGTALAR
uniref:Mitochondrial inner membrane protease subunit n=1 Tax=Xenopus tropicalis TaxID=8364 RepID=A0A803JUG1_XENTR